ncbi:polysaccharide deacetylase family protein [Caldicoprobacter algeriensis]|uniref:polysaccharide deacetylase family protein n=1 Tax=Caldicoprobacter algeriensis TaxID=699281 RepID=UPI002079D12B|nr:polysaccharide deacetylase family protein [Caldicoprobacter algeriensis]MCM8900066.1 polysaccharide deacetylase family protein [Caldicoprobacter algeriensis]
MKNSEEKLLIIHMDDIGMSYAANMAAVHLFEKGIVSSASVMVPCSWAYDFIQWWKKHDNYDVGIHITHTCEWDICRWRGLLAYQDYSNGLKDPDGFMWKNAGEVALYASKEEVEAEMELQIKQAISWGLKPTHIDSHMCVTLSKADFFESYVKVAQKYNLIPNIPSFVRDIKELNSLVEKYKLKVIDWNVKSVEALDYETKKSLMIEEIKNAKPGLNLLTIHPVIDTPEIRAIIPSWYSRYLEYKLFMDNEIGKFIQDAGLRIVTWFEAKQIFAIN